MATPRSTRQPIAATVTPRRESRVALMLKYLREVLYDMSR